MSNYYLTLGISKDADPEKIKKAYRLSCKKYHPDSDSTEKNNSQFLHIREAYETLSDKEKRKKYDAEMKTQETVIKIQQNLNTATEHKSFYKNSFIRFHSLLDDFFEGDIPGFFEEGLSPEKELYLELILSREEAEHGGTFPVIIPVLDACLTCRQTGMVGITLCPHCIGYGRIKAERSFNLVVPPGVHHGMEISMTLEDIGLNHAVLNIDIIVDNTYAGPGLVSK